MAEASFDSVLAQLEKFSDDQLRVVLKRVRERIFIHEYEKVLGASAEMILEAVHRAPELTRRMLRGVVADAAFKLIVLPDLETKGWTDITPEGNFAFDYKVSKDKTVVTIQVKLQRSERGSPVVRPGKPFGFKGDVFIVETQKTRTGNDQGAATRPYRYGEFDILAVSLQPSSGEWGKYIYSTGARLIEGKGKNEMATLQPVTMANSDYWTSDFETAVEWHLNQSKYPRMKKN